MAPRNTKQGASASSRRTSGSRSPKATASSRSRTPAASKRTKPSAKSARAKPATRTRTAAKRPAARVSVTLGRWWLLPAAAIGVLALFVWTYYPVAAVQYRETKQRTKLAAELETLQARNARLSKEVDRLKTPAGVEDYARSQLGLVKKGENVVVVVDGRESKESTKTSGTPRIDSDETTVAPAGPWTAFLDLVFGLR
ncbi:MAG TPA: septum formation initiator family protein [Coriobacteriia bacterium]|nr:septum formation initiator family protein [Coriobacteriia bacterium]